MKELTHNQTRRNQNARTCCIVTTHPFWSERLGSGSLMRARYDLLCDLFDRVFVLFITKTPTNCPLPGATMRVANGVTETHLRVYQEFIRKQSISLCFFSYDVLPEFARQTPCKTAVEIHDVMHLRQKSFHKFGRKPPIHRTKESEIYRLKNYDVVIGINNNEVTYLNQFDVNAIFIPPNLKFRMAKQTARDDTLGIIGSSAQPNIDGLDQLLKRHIPKNKLVVAGSISSSNLLTKVPENFLLNLGYVNNTVEFYEKISIALVPIRFGAGLKIKLLEALSFGCRVIATSHAVDGFPEGIEKCVTVDDDPQSWLAMDKKTTCSTPREEIARYFQANFSLELVKRKLSDALEIP